VDVATESADQSKLVQELADRAELIDLVNRVGRYADEKRFDEALDLRTEDCVSIMRNGELRLVGKEALEQGHKFLAPYSHTQHLMTNVLIEVHGDTATIRANGTSTHVYADEPEATWVVKGVYRHEAVRTPNGWRLSKTQEDRLWEEDTRTRGPKGPGVMT
jgi:3-phenylpropionate/cinnamic acid dioxygenase small subunit